MDDNGESTSTEMPVTLGDSGDAMIGAGKVRRFRWIGVLRRSTSTGDLTGVGGSRSNGLEETRAEALGVEGALFL